MMQRRVNPLLARLLIYGILGWIPFSIALIFILAAAGTWEAPVLVWLFLPVAPLLVAVVAGMAIRVFGAFASVRLRF